MKVNLTLSKAEMIVKLVPWLSPYGMDNIELDWNPTRIGDELLITLDTRSAGLPQPTQPTTAPPMGTANPTLPPIAAVPKIVYPLVVGEASTFGLNPDGSNDKGDIDPKTGENLTGFFTDPATGKEYETHNKTLVGCAIPEIVMMRTMMLTGTWAQNAGHVREWVLKYQPTLTVSSASDPMGPVIKNVKIVDVGPSASVKRCLDRTYALTHLMGGKDPEIVSWSMWVGGVQVEIKGWDFVNHVVAV